MLRSKLNRLTILLGLLLLLSFAPAGPSAGQAVNRSPAVRLQGESSGSYPTGPLTPSDAGNGSGSVDDSTATAEFIIPPGDFAPGSAIEDVTITVYFTKVGVWSFFGEGTCPGPGYDEDDAEEIRFRLVAPDGTTVTLVDFNDYITSDPAVGPVTVTFDDAAAPSVVGTRIASGIFRPNGSLADFDGLDPTINGGVWTLELADRVDGDPLCFGGAILQLTVTEAADLSVTKSEDSDPLYAGETLTYEVTVDNIGSSVATGTVLTDALPSALVYVSDNAGCTFSAGDLDRLVCPLGDIPAGASRDIEILMEAPPDAVAATPAGIVTVTNVVTATMDGTETNPSNNTTTESTFVTDQADLSVTKLGDPPATVAAGETLTYTLFVDNLGPSFARSVVLTDTITSSGVFTLLGVMDDPTRSGDSCSTVPTPGGTVLTCTLGDPLETPGYAPNNGRWEIQVYLRADEAQEVSNDVEVRSVTPDPELDNNQANVFNSITAVADLGVTKTAPGTVAAGQSMTYGIAIQNMGPSSAQNVVLIDELPTGVTVKSRLHPDLTCSESGENPTTITCGINDLAIGETRTLTVTVSVDPDLLTGHNLINGAQVSADDFDDNNSNNHVSASTYVTSVAALDASKVAAPDTVAAGETVDYTLVITNSGPSTAHDVVTLDTIPDTLEVMTTDVRRGVGGTPAGSSATCQVLAGTMQVSCPLGDVPAGEIVEIAIQSRVEPDAVPPDDPTGSILITNQITVSASNAPDVMSDVTTMVDRRHDVALQTAAAPQVAYPGDQVRFKLMVTNAGPSDAVGVVLTDTLPGALVYQTDTGGCTLVGSTPDILRCLLDTVPAHSSRAVEVYAYVRPDVTPDSVVVNEAHVTPASDDLLLTNNISSASIQILGRADLRITVYGGISDSIETGVPLTYTIFVDNLGPGSAHDLVMEKSLTSNGTFELLSVASDRPAACAPATGTFDSLVLRCELTGTLKTSTDGDTARWTIEVVVRADERQQLIGESQVFGSDEDPDLLNNRASVQHDVTVAADLVLSKTALGQNQIDGRRGGVFRLHSDQVTAGAELTYTLTVTNASSLTAENVVIQDRLPDWILIDAISPSQGSCSAGIPGDSDTPLICGLGTLGPSASATVSVVVEVDAQVPDGMPLDSDALVHSNTHDPDLANNFVTQRTVVDTWADLVILKHATPERAMAGETVTYTITVENRGPSDSAGVTVQDLIPAGLADATWTCEATSDTACTSQGAGDITEVVDLPAGAGLVYTLSGVVETPGSLTNTATVTAALNSRDPYPLDNIATAFNGLYAIFMPVVGSEQYAAGPDVVVEELIVTNDSVQVVIRNKGDMPVIEGFWVDAYIDPHPVPQAVNQVWSDLAAEGLVWGVKDAALPLEPDEILVLSVDDVYYWPSVSRVTWPLVDGTPVYAQVDSYGPGSSYGLIQENHEITGGDYNNVAGPVLAPAMTVATSPVEALSIRTVPRYRPPLR